MSLKLLLHIDNTTFGFTYFSVSEIKILALSARRSLRDFAWILHCRTGCLNCLCKNKQHNRSAARKSRHSSTLVSAIMPWATEDSESNFGLSEGHV